MADMDFGASLQDVSDSGSQKRKREDDGSADLAGRAKRLSPNLEAGDQSGNADVDALQEHMLQQAADGQNGDHTNASSTAQAALGIFPTMSIPQPTEVAFASQATEGNAENSFMDNSQAEDSFMGDDQPRSGRGSGSKPTVGSEEWHKVRKDNHKEGKSCCDDTIGSC
jgi:hypothetical protein